MGELKKCEITESGRDLTLCDDLSNCIENQIAGFTVIYKKSVPYKGTRFSRSAIAIQGKTSPNVTQIQYCPFCGSSIDTQGFGFGQTE